MGAEAGDNELIILEIIHRYVEILDKYFGNVCIKLVLTAFIICLLAKQALLAVFLLLSGVDIFSFQGNELS